MKRMGVRCAAAACVFSLAVSGCQTAFQDHEKKLVVAPELMNDFLADKPASTHRLYRNVLVHGERNLVLNHMRAGLAALEVGDLDVAEASFDVAVEKIDAIYADNKQANEARSKFTKENIKDFKGESYERAMAFYYRGLLYLMRGDYGNAQASFGSGLLQDVYAENQEYAQDFASLAFLRGWAYRCQGSESAAVQSFKEAFSLHNKQLEQEVRPVKVALSRLRAPPGNHNVLLVGEAGAAPRKMATGQFNERLVYRRGAPHSVARMEFLGADEHVAAYPFEDIFWQASTRGGRPVDYIMEGKAAFKEGAETVGKVALAAGAATGMYAMQTQDRNAAIASGVLLLGGLFAEVIANATRPDADLRQWDNLPENIYLGTAEIPPALKTLEVAHYDAMDKPASHASQTVNVTFTGQCGIAWTRTVSALAVPDEAPDSIAPEYVVKPDPASATSEAAESAE